MTTYEVIKTMEIVNAIQFIGSQFLDVGMFVRNNNSSWIPTLDPFTKKPEGVFREMVKYNEGEFGKTVRLEMKDWVVKYPDGRLIKQTNAEFEERYRHHENG